MEARHAVVADAAAICDLVNHHAERGRMLHRSLESVYESLREFLVIDDEQGRLVACCAVDVCWADLAEIKSVAVAPDRAGQGLGRRIVAAAVADARRIGVNRLFVLTYEKEFFQKQGFTVINRDTLPEKIWRECIACPKADACDEIAMIRRLCPAPAAACPAP